MENWSIPMKPVKITEANFKTLDLDQYTMEPKMNGWRVTVVFDPNISVWSRRKYRVGIPTSLISKLKDLNLPRTTILDGELWLPNQRGGYENNQDCYISLWDITEYNDTNLMKSTIEERKNYLRKISNTESIRIVKSFEASFDNYQSIKRRALELRQQSNSFSCIHGVVLKKKNSPRRDHCSRSIEHPDWLKIVWFD